MSTQSLRVLAPVFICSLAAPALASTDYNGDGRTDLAFYRPDGRWTATPVLLSNGDGGWAAFNAATPSWANEPGVIAVPGDYNRDGRTDLAFYRPDGTWRTTPVLLSDGKGAWTTINKATPSWANQRGVIAVAGDYNADGAADLAFYRPDGVWQTTPVLLSDGKGAWTASNAETPAWANTPGVTAIAGDYNGDRRTDLAFVRPDGSWRATPLLLSNGSGGWTATSAATPSWANQPGVKAIAGDYNGDRRTDLAFYRPDGEWRVTPVLMSNGNGTFKASAAATPSWANQRGVVAVAGDYDLDGRSDLAFYNPGGNWTTTPILMSHGDGGFKAHSASTPSWANQSGVVAVAGDYNRDGRADLAFLRPGGDWSTTPLLLSDGKGGWGTTNGASPRSLHELGVQVADARLMLPTVALRETMLDGGDSGYDQSDADEDAWHDALQSWVNFLKLFVLIVLGYEQYVIDSGLNGDYDGTVQNDHSQAEAFLSLGQRNGEVMGRLLILGASLHLDGGPVCSDVVVPVGTLPVHATSNGGFQATGSTSRHVSILGVFSGTVDVSFSFTLETTNYQTLVGSIDIDAPWPCANQHLTFRFNRRPL